MFRIKGTEVNPGTAWAMFALLLAITVAALGTGSMIWLLNSEWSHVSDLVRKNGDSDSEHLVILLRGLRWQFRLAVMLLILLVGIAGGLVLLCRAYLENRRSLREIKMLAGDIFASMIQGVVSTNRDGIITSINPRGCELLRASPDCVGRSIAAVSQAEIPLDQLCREVIARQSAQSDHAFALVRDGHTRRLQADCHLLRDTDGGVLGSVLHVRDVTERVLIEERLRRMERYMGLGSLAVGLHHEIKNPLTALSLHVDLLDERMTGPRTADVDEMLGVLKTEVTRLNGVLETFRNFAAFRTLAVQPTDVLALVAKAVRLVRPQAVKQKVHIAVTQPESAMSAASLDSVKFEQVLLNLIINALEAMPQGGELAIRVCDSNGELHLEIGDTGCGIPVEVQSRIFDPYFTTKSEGVGMGLAWSEKIVQQHQGRIEFETGPRGTVFKVTIPMSLGTP